MKNIKIVVEYDGTRYHGWQRQRGHRSIQQTLEEKIKLITREEVTVIGSGRTDSGVHAFNQVANFQMTARIREENLLRALNGVLPDDIVIKRVEEMAKSFHARFSVKSKKYVYHIWNNTTNTAINRYYCWHVRKELNLECMKKAACFIKGTHDFKAFCGTGSKVKNYTRTILDVELDRDDRGKLLITITADGFLRHMVRNIVGTLVEVGKGKITPEDLKVILDSRDRRKAGMTAPAHGLFLAEVHY
ncbi:MAG: tRNA pseudouridine(38-40) synthase TruA [Deltaproteobacteria bacterium]|nr:tRNA pseudouridine(38-40) synthase TruA [Deltaproteobacteria bacterium]